MCSFATRDGYTKYTPISTGVSQQCQHFIASASHANQIIPQAPLLNSPRLPALGTFNTAMHMHLLWL